MARPVSLTDRPRVKLLHRRDEQLDLAEDLIAKQARLLEKQDPGTPAAPAPSSFKKSHRVPRQPDFYRCADLVELLGLSRWTLRRMEFEGTFPKHVKLTAHATGWRRRDIEAWIAGRGRG
jgi:predicted DNA-binding transcriptional regulator AlpA